jgi:uncharacterized YccA/Bax inhibitor family protein
VECSALFSVRMNLAFALVYTATSIYVGAFFVCIVDYLNGIYHIVNNFKSCVFGALLIILVAIAVHVYISHL